MRDSPLNLSPEEFRRLGHRLVDLIGDFLESLPQRPVFPGDTPGSVRAILGARPLPEFGREAGELLEETAALLFDHSLLTGHPRHLAYIIGSPAPLSGLADLLAAAVDPNVSSWWRSAMATEIEVQTVRWIAELVGFPTDCGGLLVSGGSLANDIGLLAARTARAPWPVRAQGLVAGGCQPLRLYASDQTHVWIEKAADIYGLGTDAIRRIPSDRDQRIDLSALREAILRDRQQGDFPLMVVGNAGTTASGALDPLHELADLCQEEDLWFHIDGAYGAFAALLPDAPPELTALNRADSLALDPHKWLYQPLEAGCALVREANLLRQAFTYQPPYYHFPVVEGEEPVNFFQYGPQNSRGFRALKVWLSLQQAGRQGYQRMLAEDIRLAKNLYELVQTQTELQAFTHNLSITTFRYVPPELRPWVDGAAPEALPPGFTDRAEIEAYLNRLNDALLARLQTGGEVYLSNAVLEGTFLLRACIVNFRTSQADIEAIPEIVVRVGRSIHRP